jgi:hypothetical protein
MHMLGSSNPWSYSQGFNMFVDFCVWVLEADGVHVPPFDQHSDGDGTLRAAGLDAEGWRIWLARVVNLQYEQQQRHQQRALKDPFHAITQDDWNALLIPEAHNPPTCWQGNPRRR